MSRRLPLRVSVAPVLGGLLLFAACDGPTVAPVPLDPEFSAAGRLQTAFPGDGPLEIETLVVTAVDNSPERRRAEVRLGGAVAAVHLTEVNQPFLYAPEVEYHTEGAPWTLGLSVERPFTREALRTARTDAAVAARVAAQWNVERIGWEVRDRVLKALAGLEHARLEIGFAEGEVGLRSDLETMLESGVRAGVARPGDARLAATQAQQARLALDSARAKVTAAETEVAAALGISRRAIETREVQPAIRDLLPSAVDVGAFDTMLRRALVRRSDLLVEIAGYGAAEAELRVTLAELTPDLVLGPGILWDQKDFVLRLAGAFVPLPEVKDARLAMAIARRDEARLAFDEAQSEVLGEAEGAWARLDTVHLGLVAAEAEIVAAEEYVRQTAAAISQRALTVAARPDADLRLLAARRAAAAAELRRQMALIDLELAVEQVLGTAPGPRGTSALAQPAPAGE